MLYLFHGSVIIMKFEDKSIWSPLTCELLCQATVKRNHFSTPFELQNFVRLPLSFGVGYGLEYQEASSKVIGTRF